MSRRNAASTGGSAHPHSPRRALISCVAILTLLITVFLGARSTIFADTLSPLQQLAPANTAVTTYHNDNLRTGQNPNETILNTSNVKSSQFGKRVTYSVDGQVYAQPLFLPNVTISGAAHNVVYVATENDSVYAFDADQTSAVAPLWKTSFLGSNVTVVPSSDVFTRYANHDIDPQIGITGTPVIDSSTNTLYVVAMTKENGSQYVQRLHAIDVTTGLEKPGSPITIQASVAGTGYDASGGRISFNAKTEDQRPALLLVNGVVYISWASFGDTDPYHGWLIGYNYSGAALHQVAAYNDTPNGSEGGIWMSGDGPAADSSGNLYMMLGNGTYDLNTGGPDSSDSFLKLSTQNGLSVSDYFTPFNQSCMAASDIDLGSGGELLLPDQTNTAHPHLVVGAGKEGRIYVVDRDNMGHYTNNPSLNCGSQNQTTIDKVVQELAPGIIGSNYSTPGYWASGSSAWVYFGGIDDTLKAFQLSNDMLSSSPTSRTPESFQFPGITPAISSNGSTSGTGIVWAVSPPAGCTGNGCNPSGRGTLRAYDATNLGNELYNSDQNATRDQLDNYVKFSVPTIANGKVFVGTQTSLSIYGLLNVATPTPTPTNTPTSTPTGTPTPSPTPTRTPTPTPTPISGASCNVSYVVLNQWPGGFTANVTLTNKSTTAVNGWTLGFTFPNGQQVTQGWDGTWTQSGANVTVQSYSWDNIIAANGGSLTIGFNGSWNGTNTNPTSFTLNGATCSRS